MSKRKEPTKEITCQDCGLVFKHVGRGWCLRCVACRRKKSTARSRAHSIKAGKIKNPGVGSGGAQAGEANAMWKGGVAAYRRYGKEGKPLECENCGVPLTKKTWCVHHINEDQSDNRRENLRLVCRKCHQMIEHGELRVRDSKGKFTSRSKTPELSGKA